MRYNHQLLFVLRKAFFHQFGKGGTAAVTKILNALPIRAGSSLVGFQPGKVVGVVLNVDIMPPLKTAKAHFPQVLYNDLRAAGEKDFRRLPCTDERANIGNIRHKPGRAQLGAARGGKWDILLTLVPVLGVIFCLPMPQKVNLHDFTS